MGGAVEAVPVDRGAAQAMNLGAVADVGGGSISVVGDVAHPVQGVLNTRMLAQPGGYFRWPGLLERQAANAIDDLDAAFSGWP
jgi:hypothetical protein